MSATATKSKSTAKKSSGAKKTAAKKPLSQQVEVTRLPQGKGGVRVEPRDGDKILAGPAYIDQATAKKRGLMKEGATATITLA